MKTTKLCWDHFYLLKQRNIFSNIIFLYRVSGCRLDSTGSGHGPLAGSCETVMNLQVPLKEINFLTK
jgi:hypothetical protein